MLVGYARLSEFEKPADLAAQRRVLTAFGCEKTFTSAATLKAPQGRQDVATALRFLREGDALVVSRPDRIARTPGELLKVVDALTKHGCGFVALAGFGAPLDTRHRSSEPLVTALRAVVAWEVASKREMRVAGHARARLADPSKYAGGKKRVPDGAIRALALDDGFSPTQVARMLRIGRNTVYRYLPEGYRAPRKPKRMPRQPLNPSVIQGMLRKGMKPTAIGRALGCSRSSIYRLRDYADGRWR